MLTAINRFFQIITTTSSNFFFGHPVEYRAPSPRIGEKRTFEEAFDETAGDGDEQARKRQKTTNDVEFEDAELKMEVEEEVIFKVEKGEEIELKLEVETEVEFKMEDEDVELKLEDVDEGVEFKLEDIFEGVEFKIEEDEALN